MTTMIEKISQEDRQRLRELARKQADYAHSPAMAERLAQWKRHMDFQPGRPMIHLEMGTFEQEIIPLRMLCQGEEARRIERQLLDSFLNYELFDDDRIVPDYFGVSYQTFFTLFGQEITEDFAAAADGSQVGRHFNTVVSDLEADWEKLGPTQYGYAEPPEETRRRAEELSELFDGILPVRMVMGSVGAVPTQLLVHLMGMETMLFSMYDYPELFHTMMDRVAQDYLSYLDWLTEEELLLPTTGGEWLGNGSFCYTGELPGWEERARRPFTTKDVWGFMDSQETVGISPQMFEEFIFPCYRAIGERFGLLSYGCCEPVHSIWENCLSKLSNLRKVSISPWCDEEFMGRQLRGKRIVYFRKPSPSYLGVDRRLDEDAFRAHIEQTLRAAEGCQLEIAQRDVYTIHGDVEKARRYIAVIRECIDRCWNP